MTTTQTKILVVEDHPLNMELATDLLEAAGYLVLPAINGEEGLKLALSELPDLILMDVSLPGIDGLEATRQLKSQEATRDIPVVAVTAHAMKGDAERVAEVGCSGYITKPIDTRSFASSVASFLEGAPS